jgi:hypothetical protein
MSRGASPKDHDDDRFYGLAVSHSEGYLFAITPPIRAVSKREPAPISASAKPGLIGIR